MQRTTTLSILAATIAAIAAIATASGAIAHAAKGAPENDALAINQAGIPLVQAVTIAERHANGKAARAEYENSKQGWVFDVEVVSGPKVFDVRIDAGKGTVISSTEDQADRDDEHDKPD